MKKEQIDRINELYRKSKAEGLTEEEKKDKYLFVSEQGTMEAKLEGRVETYLTFLEPEQPGD